MDDSQNQSFRVRVEAQVSKIAKHHFLFAYGAGLLNRELPAVGIEPTLLAERDFESRASANSATPATAGDTIEIWISGNHEIQACLLKFIP